MNDLLPKSIDSEMKFPKAKRYRRLKIRNYSTPQHKVMVDVDETNTLTVTVYPADFTREQEAAL